MRYRNIGDSDLKVSVTGIGCAILSGAYGPRDEEKAAKAVRSALDLGITYFDSSDAYGNGHNEEFLRQTLGNEMSQVVVGTKFGNIRGPNGERGGTNGNPDYVPVACEASLKRLGVDTIDLYTLHRIDPEVPIEDTVGAMGRLVEEGKVRYIGLCEASADTLKRASQVAKISTLQMEYSLWTRDVEADILPACRKLGIEFVAYAPLGRGFLAGTIRTTDDIAEDDRRNDHPRFHEENLNKNVELLRALDGIAGGRGVTPSQVALAWLMSRGEDILPIPATLNPLHMNENVEAAELSLNDGELAKL
ncbi:MAG TPA: aldo/keto reductase, partial [Rhodospirillaceae bacterium]|nr:aldo/keto reductase [Rhodospirillaceae bacterium]